MVTPNICHRSVSTGLTIVSVAVADLTKASCGSTSMKRLTCYSCPSVHPEVMKVLHLAKIDGSLDTFFPMKEGSRVGWDRGLWSETWSFDACGIDRLLSIWTKDKCFLRDEWRLDSFYCCCGRVGAVDLEGYFEKTCSPIASSQNNHPPQPPLFSDRCIKKNEIVIRPFEKALVLGPDTQLNGRSTPNASKF
ncbi:hypothetical protein STAS_13202 [Striga asiatica]|uniref:Uncharacterized protein n=1 Tax=Striga asiatica TaxID=4170 RepID=A0A5A7PVY9_STRAF|nr:hypothetical protein STAS_13202 [Striga asiatica]